MFYTTIVKGFDYWKSIEEMKQSLINFIKVFFHL